MTDAAPPLEVPPRVLQFLAEGDMLTLATASITGIPRATDLRYVNDGLTLYVWTRSQSWTAKQIEQNPLVAFTITSGNAALQGSGEARVILSSEEISRAVELFSEKFPMALGASTMNISFFRIASTDLKLVDESYAGGRGETQMFAGADYQVEHVYSIVTELPADEVGSIVGKLNRVEASAGEVIAREGAPADKFVIVVDGSVSVTRGSDGSTAEVATLGPGGFFGEVAVVRDSPRTATLTATTESTLLTMDREDFRGVVAQSLGTVADFDRIIRERLGGGAP